jgi:hypothetical protein
MGIDEEGRRREKKVKERLNSALKMRRGGGKTTLNVFFP